MEFLALTWNDVYNSLLELAAKIEKSKFRPDAIVGIARGGWVVARVLSDLLGVNDLVSVSMSFYRGLGQRATKPTVAHPIPQAVCGKRLLIADDVADTGESLILAMEQIAAMGVSEVRVATLHTKPWSKITPDYYVDVTDRWILYPWEYVETIRSLVREWQGESRDRESLRGRLMAIGIPADVVERYLDSSLGGGTGCA